MTCQFDIHQCSVIAERDEARATAARAVAMKAAVHLKLEEANRRNGELLGRVSELQRDLSKRDEIIESLQKMIDVSDRAIAALEKAIRQRDWARKKIKRSKAK